MNLSYISYKNLLSKPLSSLLSLLLLVLGVAMISFMLVVNENLQNDFRKNIKDIDLVVGAKGSPLQLILSAVYQIDNPTGNINYREVKKTLHNPLVEKVIPLAYGDNYNGFRIVGTDEQYHQHYGIALAEGALWTEAMECVVGSDAARELGLKIGDTFFSQHGLEDDTHVHEEMTFKVIGILEPSGTVVDRLILTAFQSVWLIHDSHEHDHDHNHDHDHHHHHHLPALDEISTEGKEITAALVAFKSSLGMMTLPTAINRDTKFQAALPAIEINRLFELFGAGIAALRVIALAIIIISALSMFVSLFNSLKERKYELALMRSMGSSPGRLFVMILVEANILALAGIVIGFIFSRVGLWLAAQLAEGQMGGNILSIAPIAAEYLLFLLVIAVANLAAFIPAFQVTRLNISEILTRK